MKYFRLFELQNQYPTIQSYTRENTVSSVNSLYNHGDAILKGIFPENERRFPLSNIAFIRPIANTSIRFILRVKKSADDEFPRYFTSFNYFAELEQSITTPNPYFLNISLLDTNIVEFDLSDSINSFKNQLESESIRNVKMFKNNFLKIIDTKTKDTKTTTYGADPMGVVKDTQEISGEILPTEPTNITTTNEPQLRGLFGRRRNVDDTLGEPQRRGLFSRGNSVEEATNEIEARGLLRRRNITNETINESQPPSLFNRRSDVEETQSDNISTDTTNVIAKRIFKIDAQITDTNEELKPKSDVEKMVEEVIENPYLDLIDEEAQIYVDYRDLCYYLSWCLSSPTLDSIENNGVLTLDELAKFELTTKTNDTDKQDNPAENVGDETQLEPTGRFFEYDIVRLTIPATLEQSKMKFRNAAGVMQEIQTDQYGLVGRFCCEENSWADNHYVYQKTQIAPCAQNNNPFSGPIGGGAGYGYSRDYDTRVGAADFINQERDYRNVQQ